MRNICLVSKKEVKVNRKEVFKKAHLINKMLNDFSTSLKMAWKVSRNTSTLMFKTDATIEDIRYTLHTCTESGVVKKELIRKFDKHIITSKLDWVGYHLKRNGFTVEYTITAKPFIIEAPEL